MLGSWTFEAWLGLPGIVIGVLLVVGSLEFVGPFGEQGWKLAGTIVPITYIAWSVWFIVSRVLPAQVVMGERSWADPSSNRSRSAMLTEKA